ncbi:MAG: DUF4332 domain-containing protein, partial [Bacteroidia bacterium]|nr:DUF4332 domain-containing protein [Bacteroidia bacterium]
SLYRKLQKVMESKEAGSIITYSDIKKLVTNKALPSDIKVTSKELEIAREYFKEYKPNAVGGVSDDFAKNWSPDHCLHEILEFKDADFDRLVKELEKQEKPSSSLIPIKGISKVMQAKLRSLFIYDVPTLLTKGRTHAKRVLLSTSLGVDVKLVSNWIKQADLWRVEEMTTDMAYLLVLSGVRSAEDLSKIDTDKAYPILESLSASQTDFSLVDKPQLETLIKNAEEFYLNSIDTTDLGKFITNILKDENHLTIDSNSLLKELNKFIKNPNHLNSQSLEFRDKEPIHLFSDKYNTDSINDKDIGEIIVKGLGFLDEVEFALPLPQTISGSVKIRNSKDKNTENLNPLHGALVEISGVVSPSEDKTEADKNPSCITDGNGNFIIEMPDRYSFKETVTITISQGSNKQTFIKSASDILNAVPQKKELDDFLLLDSIGDEIDFLEEQRKETNKLKEYLKNILESGTISNKKKEIEYELKLKEVNHLLDGDEERGASSLASQIKELKEKYSKIKGIILNKYNNTDIKIAFNKFVSSLSNLDAKIGNAHNDIDENDSLIIVRKIFMGLRTDQNKTLPSVKLMGNEQGVIRLSTDTTPSRVFNYGMLQRLVEPAISPSAKNSGDNGRQTLSKPLDVEDFKSKLYNDPDKLPQMSSLGIGYVLNMHQAWVPDGFALGTLLYSLVLAPGEEQRLIVRENKQSYSIQDKTEGTDAVSENYALSQEDDTSAAFNYAVNQLSQGNSNYSYSAKTSSFGASLGAAGGASGFSAMLGLSGGFSKSSGKGSSSASQSNSHNEASSAAQNFQHNIKSASDKISQAKRISISSATSEVSDSVATKIIANHNHSHAMTIQYWEVMRRYRMETCIEGIDLVLFIPLKTIRFLPPNSNFYLDEEKVSNFNKPAFTNRYGTILKYANSLQNALPSKYLTGLSLIKKYASFPKWEMEDIQSSNLQFTIKIKGKFLSCDDIRAHLVLKNGKGTVAGTVKYNRTQLPEKFETSDSLRQAIRDIRNETAGENEYATLTFLLPARVIEDDYAYIKISYTCEPLKYHLYKNPEVMALDGDRKAKDAYDAMWNKIWDAAKDDKYTWTDNKKRDYFASTLPEAWVDPNVEISSSEMNYLGRPEISLIKEPNSGIRCVLSSSSLDSTVYVQISTDSPKLRYSEFQEMEALLQHVASETLHYSKIAWAALSDDERAMLLEQYTINMDFNKIDLNIETENSKEDESSATNNEPINIPLLNCVNVKKLLGFYGNCMLLPFTFPQSLAKRLGKTAADIQDSLYRYHTNNFRAPSTTISLPTDGMIGEAVLGETNVSEKIDLTRFWNWQDSPIDKMEIDSSYLNANDYLAGKTTKDISALNLQGATAAIPVTNADLISALVNKQAPKFDNITGLDQLRDVLNAGTSSAAQGLQTAVTTSADVAKGAADLAKTQINAEKDLEQTKINAAKDVKIAELENAEKKKPVTDSSEQGNSSNTTSSTLQPSDSNKEAPSQPNGQHTDEISEDDVPTPQEDEEMPTDDIEDDDVEVEEGKEDGGVGNDTVISTDMPNDNILTDILNKLTKFVQDNPNATPEEFLQNVYKANYNTEEINKAVDDFCKTNNTTIEDIIKMIKDENNG